MLTFAEFQQILSEESMVLYHGGKRYVSKPNLKITQQTDKGMYGKGFYTTTNPKHAAMYGSKVSHYDVSPNAKVLSTAFDPKQADAAHVNDVVAHHKSTNPSASAEELNQIRTNHQSWHQALNQYADHHKYDMVHLSQKHYEPEIVVKNPKALTYKGKFKVEK